MRTFAEHAYCVYAAVWSPQHADIFATASGDCTLKVWDVRQGLTLVHFSAQLERLVWDSGYA